MNPVSTALVFAIAFAAPLSASLAQDTPKAAIGVAFLAKNNRVKVAEVRPGGPADLMGVRAGDTITHAGGKRIISEGKLSALIRALKVGDAFELTVKRDGKSLHLTGTAVARQ